MRAGVCSFLLLVFVLLMSAPRVQSSPDGAVLHTTTVAFPELVGIPGDEARNKVLAERPDLSPHNVMVHAADAMITMDYRINRVRIFVDKDNKVTATPQVG